MLESIHKGTATLLFFQNFSPRNSKDFSNDFFFCSFSSVSQRFPRERSDGSRWRMMTAPRSGNGKNTIVYFGHNLQMQENNHGITNAASAVLY
jgi:hypothetical protein